MPPRRRGLGPAADRGRSNAGPGFSVLDVPVDPTQFQPESRRSDESSGDYIERVLLGGDREEREQFYGQRAGRAATAARYGEDTGDFVSDWQFPDSSRVKAYQWDQAIQQLRVRFIKYGTPWVYNDVDLATFQAFDATDSKGKFINRILNSYPYRRATVDEEAQYFQGV
jgi:hypothetical protein